MSKPVKVIIITGFGLNCERETACGFRMCGADVDEIHLNRLIANPEQLAQYQILAFIGGFSFGDHLGAGTVFANRVKSHLGQQLSEFIAAGKLVIGICNGFQTLSRMGLVPALDKKWFEQQIALARNEQGVFRDTWITVRGNPDSPCIFTKGIDLLPLPIRHGEGKFMAMDEQMLARLEAENLVALRYVCPETGEAAQGFPENPNGSQNAIAGVCDPSGRIFGLMPHPEGYLSPYNHPHWTRQKINNVLPKEGLGVQVFRNAVTFARENLV